MGGGSDYLHKQWEFLHTFAAIIFTYMTSGSIRRMGIVSSHPKTFVLAGGGVRFILVGSTLQLEIHFSRFDYFLKYVRLSNSVGLSSYLSLSIIFRFGPSPTSIKSGLLFGVHILGLGR